MSDAAPDPITERLKALTSFVCWSLPKAGETAEGYADATANCSPAALAARDEAVAKACQAVGRFADAFAKDPAEVTS